MSKMRYAVVKTRGGWIGLLANETGITRVTLPQTSRDKAEMGLVCREEAEYSEEWLRETIDQLKSYFNGDKVHFTCTLDISKHTKFEKDVWEATQNIPYGETTSYLEIARRVGKPLGPRAVGQALGRNPIPIVIPCHRVLTHDGKIGGFGGGLEMKRYLLDLEQKGNK
jgi:methylated-DNA-[protein]-cysteine S-methyltransferase